MRSSAYWPNRWRGSLKCREIRRMLSISKYHNSTVIRYYNSCRRTIVFAIGSKDRDLDSSLADDRGLDSSYRSPKNLPKNLRRWPHPQALPLDLSAEFHILA